MDGGVRTRFEDCRVAAVVFVAVVPSDGEGDAARGGQVGRAGYCRLSDEGEGVYTGYADADDDVVVLVVCNHTIAYRHIVSTRCNVCARLPRLLGPSTRISPIYAMLRYLTTHLKPAPRSSGTSSARTRQGS